MNFLKIDMSNRNINGLNDLLLSDNEIDVKDELFFVKLEPDIDDADVKEIIKNTNSAVRSSEFTDDNLFSTKITCHDNSNSFNILKMKTENPLSKQNNLSNENMENSKTNNLQKPFSIRVRSEFSEKNMIENCLLNTEAKKVFDKQHKQVLIIPTSKVNIRKKNTPIILLRKIAVPRKKLKFLTKPIKTASENLNNIPIKVEDTCVKVEPPKLEANDENCKKCSFIEEDNSRPLYCAYCGFTTLDKNSLRTHLFRHVGNPYKCTYCKYTTTRPVHMKEHIKKHTGESFQCSQCSFKTIYQRSLKYHLLTHTESPKHICEICKASFYRPQYLKRHMRRHTKENRLECDYCKKEFFRKTHLLNHINRHTGNKPFKCEICQLGFIQMYHLQRHQLTHFKEKKYACNLCPQKFDRVYSLKLHKTTHTGAKLYECDVCQLKFIRSEHLKRHKADHTSLSKKMNNKRTYKCKFCLFKALSSFVFNEHINKHVDSNLIICNECGNSFEQKSNLILHWRRRHK